jgi:hypothetical protein
MPDAPVLRNVNFSNAMPTQQAGDLLLNFAFNGSAVPTFSADWTLLVSANPGYGVAVAYKISNGNSTFGSVSSGTGSFVAAISGASTTTATGSTPSFLGGINTSGGAGNPATFPAVGRTTADAYLRLSLMYAVGGGGNPWQYGTLSAGVTLVGSNVGASLFSGGGTGSFTYTETYGYGVAQSGRASIQILPPNPPGFFAMF